jgi:SAM-dependent methyltransferase
MASVDDKVERGILEEDHWYVGSQFEWAEKPYIRRIYERRFQFIVSCIGRSRRRFNDELGVLDAGCGDGYWLSRLERIPGISLTGVEYNPLRRERARSAAVKAELHGENLLTFTSEQPFHVVLLSQVIEHVEDDVALLEKMCQLLLPGGTLILGTPNEGSALHRLRRRFGPAFATDHVHFYTEPDIAKKIVDSGFRIETVMHEVFFLGVNRVYNWLNSRQWGFLLLERLAQLIPSECSDYYFECIKR